MKLSSEGIVERVARGNGEEHEITVNFASGPLKNSEVVLTVVDREAYTKLNISDDRASMLGKPLQNVRVKLEFY